MKKILTGLILLFIAHGFSWSDPLTILTNQLLPVEASLILWDSGDLNQDGRDDLAWIMQTGWGQSLKRVLIISLQEANGLYREALRNEQAVLLAGQGGVSGDPLASLTVQNNSINLSFYDCDRFLWTQKYQFYYMDNDWMLIGHDNTRIEPTTQDATVESYDLLSGTLLITQVASETQVQLYTINRGKKKLISLRQFNISLGNTQF